MHNPGQFDPITFWAVQDYVVSNWITAKSIAKFGT